MRDAVNSSLTYAFYTSSTFPYTLACFGPGLYDLKEQGTTLEALPGKIGGRTFDACPSGYVPTPDRDTDGCIPCPAGRYSTASYQRPAAEVGAVLSTLSGCAGVCPRGYYCPPASTQPVKCPPGRWGGSSGMATADCSGQCEAGYFCPQASVSARPLVCGNASVFCPAGSATRLLVDAGFYTVPESSRERTPVGSRSQAAAANSPDYDDATRHAQQPCGPGTFCLLGRRYLCPVGVYGATSYLKSALCTAPCPMGSYCPIGSSYPILCPPGTYGDVAGLSDPSCSGKCQPGFFCSAGSTSAQQAPCPAGRYGAEAGLTTPECSPLCEAFNRTDSVGSRFCEPRICHEGYVCPPASTSAKQQPCGSPAVYCPPHSVIPTPVTTGWYTIGSVSAAGQTQQTLDADTRTSQVVCEPGYFCMNGLRLPCASGFFGSTAGLSSGTCSGQCDAGYICGPASFSARSMPCGSGPQSYCPRGSGNSTAVPAGFYSVNGSLTTRSAILPCPQGTYCTQGQQLPCPAGRYSLTGSKSEECDGFCAAGFFCLERSASPTQYACPAGRYGLEGEQNASCRGQCLPGYFCPLNSTSPFQFECGGDNTFCPAGSGAPLPVRRGYYSSGANATIRQRQDFCDVRIYYSTPPAGRKRLAICPDTTVY